MCPTIAEMGVRLWNWDFSRFGTSQPFRSCEMRVTVLRNGTRVPKSASQLRNSLRNGTFGCEIENFHALELRNAFRSCETDAPVLRSGTRVPKWVSQLRKFSQRLLQCCGMVWQQNVDFAEAAKSRRPLFFPCFCPVFAPFDSDFAPKDFLQFLFNSSWFWSSKNLYYIKTN